MNNLGLDRNTRHLLHQLSENVGKLAAELERYNDRQEAEEE